MQPVIVGRSPAITLFSVEEPIAERLVRMGLTKSNMYRKEPDELFVFPMKVPRRRDLSPQDGIQVTIAMQLIETVRRVAGINDVTPEHVANWLCDQASRTDYDLWVKAAQCLRRLVWIYIPKNINAWDLRRLASLIDYPETLYWRARRFQNEFEFFAATGMNEEDLLKFFNVDGEQAEAHMYNADDVALNG